MESFDNQVHLLKQELKSYGDDIINHIKSLHSQLQNEKISLKTDPKLVIQSLQQDVINLVKEAQEHSEYWTQNHNEIEECEKLMIFLVSISTASEVIAQCEELINSNDLTQIQNHMIKLKDAIDHLPSQNSAVGTGQVCSLLRRESAILKSRFQTRLKRLLQNCVHIDSGRILVVKKLKGAIRDEDLIIQEPIALKDIWNVLRQFSNFKECIEILVIEIWTKVIRPLWKLKKISFPRTIRNESSTELVYDSFTKENTSSGKS
jgi:hypothetical protein